MMMKILAIICLIFFFSCSDNTEEGPVKVYYGENICEKCKMIISEKNFAAQYKAPSGKAVNFDDLGCMFHYMDTEEKETISQVYVIDYNSNQWIEGQNAYYVWADSITTPMGHGIIAFKERSDAEQFPNTGSKYLGDITNASKWALKSNLH